MAVTTIEAGVIVEQIRMLPSGEIALELRSGATVRLDWEAWSALDLPTAVALDAEQAKALAVAEGRFHVRSKALELLANREHSSWELRQKLRQRFQDPKAIDECLVLLEERGYLSDERFAQRFLESRIANRDHGPYRLLAELQQRGISRELAESLLHEYDSPHLWLEKAERAKERILRRSKTVNPQSLWSKLHQQGFSGATISAALRDLPQPEL